MMSRMVGNKWFWILMALGLFLYWRFRQNIAAALMSQSVGKQAVSDASMNGYTTYNTSLYTPPPWLPILKFFAPNPYVPVPQQSQSYSQQ